MRTDPAHHGHSPGFSRGVEHRLARPGGQSLWWIEGGAGVDTPARGTPPTVLVLHGGPGGQTRPATLAWWEGLPCRWVAVDQRGCGRSTPAGSLDGQTLDGLVEDLEALRRHLGLARWAVAAGSWGVRLALALVERAPGTLAGAFLRSPFLGSLAETRRYIAPWRRWLGAAGQAALGEPGVAAVEDLFQAPSGATPAALAALDRPDLARAWSAFDEVQAAPGGWAATPQACAEVAGWARPLPAEREAALRAGWRIHAWHGLQAWGRADGAGAWPTLPDASAWGGPLSLVWGEADACCDPGVARRLAQAWPGARHQAVPGAGHRMADPALAPVLAQEARAWALALGPQAALAPPRG